MGNFLVYFCFVLFAAASVIVVYLLRWSGRPRYTEQEFLTHPDPKKLNEALWMADHATFEMMGLCSSKAASNMKTLAAAYRASKKDCASLLTELAAEKNLRFDNVAELIAREGK